MLDLGKRIRNSRFLLRGEALVGVAFFVSGIIVAWQGAGRLGTLYRQFSGYFPLSLPPNVGDTLLLSFPLIFQIFIGTVGSLCAVILGLVWMIAGVADAATIGKRRIEPPDMEDPEIVAESLRTGQPLHWKSYSLPVRITAKLGARMRFMSPVSYALLRHAAGSTVKLLLIGVAIAATFYVLRSLPELLLRYGGIQLKLVVPLPGPLYYLLALLIVVNAVIAASLVPLKRPGYTRTCESVVLRGTGDPHFFFALLEEGCRLLSGTAAFLRVPKRLELEVNTRIQGTLVESSPEPVSSISRPAGYFCLPLVVVFLTLGFSRLIDFHKPLSSIPYATFLSTRLLDYVLEVAFALGMILVGVYFGEWSRQLLGVRRFRSALVFCHLVGNEALGLGGRLRSSAHDGREGSETVTWKGVDGVDPRFAMWAREPQGSRSFRLQLCWAEVTTESVSDEAPRSVADMQRSEQLETSMHRLIRLPFLVGFEPGPEASAGRQHHSEVSGSSPGPPAVDKP